jgi:2,4-dienoyl-CoA reductase-like NADH-dependent reductase (Old Yellow Enzyme family)
VRYGRRMALFDPFILRGLSLRNRIVVSPMCQYSSEDGFATDWHLVHLGSRAAGGAALVFTEAAAVSPEGRISASDLGIYLESHVDRLATIVAFIHTQGALAGVQLAHAGRKASTAVPWQGGQPVLPEQGGWLPVGPSAIPFDTGYQTPRALDGAGIAQVVGDFAQAARRARIAGFDVVELHAAHGYLLHEFLSPLSNQRGDDHGGSFNNRIRLLRQVVTAVRMEWPQPAPLLVRISATDYAPGGWDIEQSVALAKVLVSDATVDLIDCSSGGLVPGVHVPLGPGYQVPFAARIRAEAGIATGAVGLITGARQADEIIAQGQADVVLLARELLRDPYFPLHAAHELGAAGPWPPQYLRARPPGPSNR